jgi:tetratricopeptide (TPR) repeat protein
MNSARQTPASAARAFVTRGAVMPDRERRTRPIYQCLDSGNYKTAIKLLDSLLDKYNDEPLCLVSWPLFSFHSFLSLSLSLSPIHILTTFPNASLFHSPLQTLKALALERQDKKQDAMELLGKVKAMRITDSQVLSTMLIVYKCAHEVQEAVECFENAVEIKGDDEELVLQLYFVYGRQARFDKQQEVAMKLYKKFKQPRYVYWSGINLLLMALGEQGDKAQSLLQLAQIMIQRNFPEDKPIHAEDLWVYTELLCLQKKFREAQIAVQDRAHSWTDHIEKNRYLAKVYEHQRDWASVRDTFENLLTDEKHGSPDDISFFRKYHNAFVRDLLSQEQSGDGPADDEAVIPVSIGQLAPVAELVQKLQKQQLESKGKPARGPFLFEMELEVSSDAPRLEKLGELLSQYFERFGGKNCFFEDVKSYLDQLSGSLASQVIEHAGKYIQDTFSATDAAVADARCRYDVSYEQIRRFCTDNKQATEETWLEDAKRCASKFFASQALTRSAEETERGFGDSFAILGAHAFFSAYEKRQNTDHLKNAVLLLKLGLHFSPFNFQMKLSLIRLYCHPDIGLFDAAHTLFESLEIKQILLESTGHLAVCDALRYGFSEKGLEIMNELVDFHRTHWLDSGEMLVQAYRNHNYQKVIEFAEFNQRIGKSYAFAMAEAEIGRLAPVVSLADAKAFETLLEAFDVLKHPGLTVSSTSTAAGISNDSKHDSKGNDGDIDQKNATVEVPMDRTSHGIPYSSLATNENYSVVACWDPMPPVSTLHHRLNRPSRSLSMNSFDIDTPASHTSCLAPQKDSAAVPTAYLDHLTICRILSSMQKAMMKGDALRLQSDHANMLSWLERNDHNDDADEKNKANLSSSCWSMLSDIISLTASFLTLRDQTSDVLSAVKQRGSGAGADVSPLIAQLKSVSSSWSDTQSALRALEKSCVQICRKLHSNTGELGCFVRWNADSDSNAGVGTNTQASCLPAVAAFIDRWVSWLVPAMRLWLHAAPPRKKMKRTMLPLSQNAPDALKECLGEFDTTLTNSRSVMKQIKGTVQSSLKGILEWLSADTIVSVPLSADAFTDADEDAITTVIEELHNDVTNAAKENVTLLRTRIETALVMLQGAD